MRILVYLLSFYSMAYFKSYCHVVVQGFSELDSLNFLQIISNASFVDKTMFIKEFIINNKTSLITAPPGFGKSTNLGMLKSFLEIEVNEDGQPITKSNYMEHPVKDTPNYQLFTDHSLKITKEIKLMDEQFGRTPVLSVSFRCSRPIHSFDDALKSLRDAAHNAFKQHRYLSKSQNLSEDERAYVSTWCSDQEYHFFGKHRVSSCLRELASFLSKHFGGRRVLVMVDDHDSLTKTAMLNVTSDDELDDIVRFSVCMLNAVLKNHRRYIWGGLITGVSLIPVFGSTDHNFEDPDAFHVYRFLGDHQFTDFYGLTKEELDSLLVNPKIEIEENLIDNILAQYSGYRTSSGKNMYNLYSILKLLQHKKIKSYWTKFNGIPNFSEVLKIPAVNKAVKKLLRGETINIEITEDKLTVDDIVDYRNILLRPEAQAVTVAIKFFYFLLEEGYLTHTDREKLKNAVKIPNDEIKTAFTEHLEP